ncbi:MAG TPA: hypothetical protein VGK73_38575 [Polyangiaceae bacterium]
MNLLRIVCKGLAVAWFLACVLYLALQTWWSALALAGLLGGLLLWATVRKRPIEPVFGTDSEGVWSVSGATQRSVRWADLCAIGIITTDQGPYQEDVFWVFVDRNGSECSLPGSKGSEILERLSGLPGVDYGAVLLAAGSTDNAAFVVWKGEAGAASGLATARP